MPTRLVNVHPAGRAVLVLLGMSFVFVLGLIATRLTIPGGVEDFAEDPERAAVARRALSAAWAHHDNPIGRAMAPALRVVAVVHRPGHCTSPPPRHGLRVYYPGPVTDSTRPPALAPSDDDPSALRDYVTTVRGYTAFGIPWFSIHGRCGGEQTSLEPS